MVERRPLLVASASMLMLLTVSLVPAAASAPPRCLGQVVTIEGTGGDDRLTGTAGDDVISAGRGWDVVAGRGGNDVICGGVGSDRVRGGRGDDRLSGGVDGTTTRPTTRYGDVLAGGGGDDEIRGGGGRGSDRVTYASAPRGVQVDLAAGTATGQGVDKLMAIDNAKGSRFNDSLSSNDFASYLGGGRGDDRLVGIGGIPILVGDAGDDRAVLQSAGIAIGGNGEDVLTVHTGFAHSSLYGDAGADTLLARGDSNIKAVGGGGDDIVDVGAGDDDLFGQDGDDTLNAGTGDDRARGGAGTDLCRQAERTRGCER